MRAKSRIIGDALGNIMATIMIHHIKNISDAYDGVHTAGCIMAQCAIRIVSPTLPRDDVPPPSAVISIAGTVPGMDMVYRGDGINAGGHDLQNALDHLSAAGQLATLATPAVWIGAVVGALMIYAAIQLRRRRELAD